jgi:hypothetical protein
MNGDMHELVDTDRGLVSRRIFIEPGCRRCQARQHLLLNILSGGYHE